MGEIAGEVGAKLIAGGKGAVEPLPLFPQIGALGLREPEVDEGVEPEGLSDAK
jgi:hypothetical protein